MTITIANLMDIRTLSLQEIDEIHGGISGSCLAGSTLSGAAVGALFGNPILGAGLGLARGIIFCPSSAH